MKCCSVRYASAVLKNLHVNCKSPPIRSRGEPGMRPRSRRSSLVEDE